MREWIKLYTEVAHDRKMAALTDREFRVCINLFALAGLVDDGGVIPPIEDIAFQLRMTDADLCDDMQSLARLGILQEYHGVWMVTHWIDRQAKPPSASREAILERVHKHRAGKRNETVTTLQNVTNVTEIVTTKKEREKEKKEEIPPLPFQHTPGNGTGRSYADKMQALNDKLGPELRRMLADAILKITGQYDLANTETDAGTAVLYAAHEAAVAVYQMGYKAAEDLMIPEDDWYANDFRGQRHERPTQTQFLTQASKCKASPHEVKPFAVEEWR